MSESSLKRGTPSKPGILFLFFQRREKRARVSEGDCLLHLNFSKFCHHIIYSPFPRHIYTKTSSFLSLHSKIIIIHITANKII